MEIRETTLKIRVVSCKIPRSLMDSKNKQNERAKRTNISSDILVKISV